MAFTYTEAQKVLKEDYKTLVEQLNNEVFMLAQIERNSDSAEGLRAYHALHIGRNGGGGARQTGETLPTAGAQSYTNALVPLRKFYQIIQIERQLMSLTATNSGAFVRAVDSEMEGARKDVEVDHGRMVWGTSDGVIAATGVTTAATTVVLATTTSATQLRQLSDFIGGLIDIGTVAAPTTIASARTLVSVDATAKTIVISGAVVTTTTAHRIFRSGNGGASSNSGLQNDGQRELTGLQTIVSDTGILHSVDPSTVPVWKSTVSSNGGVNRSVSEALVNNALQQVETVSGGQVDLLVSNYGVFNALVADMRAMRRNIDNVDLKAGFTGIAYSSAGMGGRGATTRSLKWDRDCPNNQLFGISTGDLVTYEATGWEWVDEDGSVLLRDPSLDQFSGRLARYYDVAAKRRNSHFVIRDLTEG